MSRKVTFYPSVEIHANPKHVLKPKRHHFIKDGEVRVEASPHSNGMGLVGKDSTVAVTVKVFQKAAVFGKSGLFGFGIISDHAKIFHTKACGDYEVSEDSEVKKSFLNGLRGRKITISDGSKVEESVIIGGPVTMWDGSEINRCTIEGRVFIDHAKLANQKIAVKGKRVFINGLKIATPFLNRKVEGIAGTVSVKIDPVAKEAMLEIIGDTVRAITTRPQKT